MAYIYFAQMSQYHQIGYSRLSENNTHSGGFSNIRTPSLNILDIEFSRNIEMHNSKLMNTQGKGAVSVDFPLWLLKKLTMAKDRWAPFHNWVNSLAMISGVIIAIIGLSKADKVIKIYTGEDYCQVITSVPQYVWNSIHSNDHSLKEEALRNFVYKLKDNTPEVEWERLGKRPQILMGTHENMTAEEIANEAKALSEISYNVCRKHNYPN